MSSKVGPKSEPIAPSTQPKENSGKVNHWFNVYDPFYRQEYSKCLNDCVALKSRSSLKGCEDSCRTFVRLLQWHRMFR